MIKEGNSSTHRCCCRCKELKSIEEFSSHKGKPFNKSYTCKVCKSSTKRADIIKYYQSGRNYNLRLKYKMTVEDYGKMHEGQNGLCALCNRERLLVIDHNHETGKVRGLLCNGCNLGLGQFEHDLSLFDKAKEYIACRR